MKILLLLLCWKLVLLSDFDQHRSNIHRTDDDSKLKFLENGCHLVHFRHAGASTNCVIQTRVMLRVPPQISSSLLSKICAYFRPTTILSTKQRKFWRNLLLLLLMIGEIESNPGPGSPSSQNSWSVWDFQLLSPQTVDLNNSTSFGIHAGSSALDVSRGSSGPGDEADIIPKSSPRNPVIASANVNSLTSKIDSGVRPFLQMYNFAAFALQETKLIVRR